MNSQEWLIRHGQYSYRAMGNGAQRLVGEMASTREITPGLVWVIRQICVDVEAYGPHGAGAFARDMGGDSIERAQTYQRMVEEHARIKAALNRQEWADLLRVEG